MSAKKTAPTRRPLKVLLVGTLPPPIGGATVMFESLVNDLGARDDVETIVVNTTGVRRGGVRGPFRFVRILWQMARGVRRADVVVLHASPTGIPLVGPFVYAAARLWHRPLVLRKVGGMEYYSYGPIRRAVARWVVRKSDLYLVETKALVRAAQEDGVAHVRWYPNCRPSVEFAAAEKGARRRCRRFVFLSQVTISKGVHQLIDAAERFDEKVSVDVYGPFQDGLSEQTFSGLKRVRYCGVVPPRDSVRVLARYDAVLLPTYWMSEGYPGIILESFNAGVPVITTRWMFIPEIVDESCGLLVEPKNADALYDAMRSLVVDDQLYVRLCAGAAAKKDLFDAEKWTDWFVENCRKLARDGD